MLLLVLKNEDGLYTEDQGPLCLAVIELAVASVKAAFQDWNDKAVQELSGGRVNPRKLEVSINLFLNDLHAVLADLDKISKSRTLSDPHLLKFNYYVLCFKQWARIENTTPVTTEKQKTLDQFLVPKSVATVESPEE